MLYTLRLLAPHGASPKRKSQYPSFDDNDTDVTVECTHVELLDGNAIFKSGESIHAIFSLSTFLWVPLGKTPPFIRMAPYNLSTISELSLHTFTFNLSIDSPLSQLDVSLAARAAIVEKDVIYLVDDNGEYVYSAPLQYSSFKPLGFPVNNLKYCKRENVEEAPRISESGFTGSSESSSSSGSSGTSGVNGESGSSGINGASLLWQGEWKEIVNYKKGDLVKCEGSLWIGLEKNIGEKPAKDHLSWDILIPISSLK